jgi:DNA-binding response OmpR family regulator
VCSDLADNQGAIRLQALVIEDRRGLADFVRKALINVGTADVQTVRTVGAALHTLEALEPDLVVVGLAPTGLAQVDACRKLRAHSRSADVPIIVVSVGLSESDTVRALDGGADDCVRSPCGTREFAARVRALVRRARRGA